jgi:hypothetical protein
MNLHIRRVVCIVALALGVGCGSRGNGQSHSAYRTAGAAAVATVQAERLFKGEEVFRGVLFGIGPVARLLPEVWESPEVAAAKEKNASKDLRLKIQAKMESDFASLPQSEPDLSPKAIAAVHEMIEASKKAPLGTRVRPRRARRARCSASFSA